jgi:hypothetical protein
VIHEAEVRTAPRCVECGTEDFFEGRHVGWDPKGPLCADCWLVHAQEWIDQQRQEEDRECLG